MGYKVGVDKRQSIFFPPSLDEYVGGNHICRFIDAFTEQLDMAGLEFKYATCKEKGCRPYDPRMMLNLYIYGYLHRVRSSRRLEAEARRNVEVMWLMERLEPDDKTISNFRRENAKGLKEAFKVFVKMSREFGLYGGEVETLDSVKIRANNSLKNNHNTTTVGNALSKIEKKIADYLKALDENDKAEAEEERVSSEKIEAALIGLTKRKEKYEELKRRLEAGETEVSTVDSEARLMRNGGEGRKLDVSYNVQTVVDSKYHLVAGFEVSNCASDAGNLETMSEEVKEILEVEKITILADAGYYDGQDIANCEENGVNCLVAKPAAGGPKKEEGYNRKDFVYDKEKDVYVCPCGNELPYKCDREHISGRDYFVYSSPEACKNCEKKSMCTKADHREVLRLTCQDTLDVVDERTRSNRGLYRKRQEIVEHCFGTVKAVWGYRQFLCRKKVKVSGEMALTYIAYNMRRIFNIFAEGEGKMVMETR